MSFDIWLCCFKNGEDAYFPREIVEEAFGRFAERREPKWWSLHYPDGGRSELDVADGPMVSGLTVGRPPAHPAFWEGILSVLQRSSSVLFWPEGGAVVADASVIPDLPADLIEVVGIPMVVTHPEEIVECIVREDNPG
jgi:hypothetical protein